MTEIIIKGRAKYGKTLGEIAENLRKDGVTDHGIFMSDQEREQAELVDKKFGFRKMDEQTLRKAKEKLKTGKL